jgi:hypothetical protein
MGLRRAVELLKEFNCNFSEELEIVFAFFVRSKKRLIWGNEYFFKLELS